jgi:hypothetical protein
MIYASLILNILVLLPVTAGLLLNLEKMHPVFGPKTTAREILLCLYLTILLGSVLLLFLGPHYLDYVRALLLSQIVYKVMSVILVADKKTPVIWFNLAIAVFHGFTLYSFG